jgi:hypothetical protein
VRYVQFLLGVMTVLFLPVPLVNGPGAGSVVEDLDRLAWRAMTILVMAGSLVCTSMPRATLRLFGCAGLVGVLFGAGTLTPTLVLSGVWTLLIAGIGLLDKRTRSYIDIRGVRSSFRTNRISGSSAQPSVQ